MSSLSELLRVENLRTSFRTDRGLLRAVDGVDLEIRPGRTLGVVGESGSGKSVTALSIMGLIPKPPAEIVSGDVLFEGRDLTKLSEKQLEDVRGREIAMIFQDPMTSLNPTLTIGTQITETIRRHYDVPKQQARKKAVELLEEVQIPRAADRLDDYPHRFSGGMRQRVMIAIALSCDPKLLIADEPTTALDVTVQAQVMDLLAELQRESGMGMILITHDLGVVADVADICAVMYAGRIVEHADVHELYANPAHPYTKALLGSIPRLDLKGQEVAVIKGLPPTLTNLPTGCSFHPRCSYVKDRCRSEEPPLYSVNEHRDSACHYWEEVLDGSPE